MEINKSIHNLRIVALLLFILPFLGLILSLIFNNYLVSSSKFASKNLIYPFEDFKIGNKILVECSEENNWCKWRTHDRFDQCQIYFVEAVHFYPDGAKILDENIWQKLREDKKPLLAELKITDKKIENCILNSKLLSIYKISPKTFEKISHKVQDFNLGTSQVVNPIFYGESSISNIVKRYPINYIFKPLLFLASLVMISYWFYYNNIFNFLFQEKKIRIFYIFGILSAIFLFLHVFFLGSIFENKILSQLRRSYIIFFILFEILAQVFLIKNIINKKSLLLQYLNSNIVTCKFVFVSMVCLSTLIILMILLLYELSSKVDYILEWNYFLILIIFYFLSFLMWKKN